VSARRLQVTDTAANTSRRAFLKTIPIAGAGLMIGIYWPASTEAAAQGTAFEPNAWLKITSDGEITIMAARPEMGQGIRTALPMIVAEELDADWTRVRITSGITDGQRFGDQSVGGSESVQSSFTPLRQAGAAAREMLVAAAALQWGVPAGECTAEKSVVTHAASNRSAKYGDLAAAAAKLPVPAAPKLKDPASFRLLGTRIPRVDLEPKVDGTAQFGIDVKLPGMLYAAIARPPVFGSTLDRYEITKAKSVAGVKDVVKLGDSVAVLADNSWTAKQGRDALGTRWQAAPSAQLDSAAIRKQFVEAAKTGAKVFRNDGNLDQAMAGAAKKLTAEYDFPFLAHATMEPQNCTVHVKADGVDVWVPTQIPNDIQAAVAKAAGVPETSVRVNFTFLGGGFGRRLFEDYAIEAARLSKAASAPVKVVWTREDDMQHDYYRPASYHAMSGAVDAAGALTAFGHKVVAPSILNQNWGGAKDGLDGVVITQTPCLYVIPNVRLEYAMSNTPIPVGWWRSVYTSHCGCATECFIDELAHAAGKDPFSFRRDALAGDRVEKSGSGTFHTARLRGVLELAASSAGWGTALPKGRARGIACYAAFGSYAAHVAEVSVEDSAIKVHRVVCAVDCGINVNPGIIEAQMQGSIAFALSTLKQAITISGGRVEQSNFHNFGMLRINEMPVVEVHIVKNTEVPGGIGEPGIPSVVPAVLNGVFAATGKRLRRLPVRPDDFS